MWLFDLNDIEISGNSIDFGYVYDSETIVCDHLTRNSQEGAIQISVQDHLQAFICSITFLMLKLKII